jgi:hypothetical protein
VHPLTEVKLPPNRQTQPDAGVGLQHDISRHLLPTPTSDIPDRDQKERSALAGATAQKENDCVVGFVVGG